LTKRAIIKESILNKNTHAEMSMKKFYTPLVCALGVATCGALMASNNYINLASEADFPALLNNDKVIALFIYPPGQPCKNMAASAAKVAQDDKSTTFIIVDIRICPSLRNQYRVGGLPTMIFFRQGVELARSTGQRDSNSLRALIAKTFLGTHKAFMTNPVAYTTAWIKGHFQTNPVCENQY